MILDVGCGYDPKGDVNIDIGDSGHQDGRNKVIKYSPIRNFLFSDASLLPFKDNSFDVSCISFALHDMPLSIRKKVLDEMVRVTKPKGIITVIDYALPKNKIGRYLVYHLIKIYESKYYPDFVKSDLNSLLAESRIEMEIELPIMFGAGRILKGAK